MQPNIKTQTVKGADLLRQNSGVKIYADKYYHITEVEEDDYENLPEPPEEDFRPEFIKMVEESVEDVRMGRTKVFKSVEALFEDLDKE